MQRVFPSKTTDANEASVNNDNNEQFTTSDSRPNAETSEDEGSALEHESDVVNCSLLSLLTETSFAFAVLLGKTRCMLIRYSLSRNINIVAWPRLDRRTKVEL